tara:strand:+ start:1665 stop:1988 length:324 start_codon:yes stop_codon:yes gene_type:complete
MIKDLTCEIDGVFVQSFTVTRRPAVQGEPQIEKLVAGYSIHIDGNPAPAGSVEFAQQDYPPALLEKLQQLVAAIEEHVAVETGIFTGSYLSESSTDNNLLEPVGLLD